MARKVTKYTVDVNTLSDDIALFTVVGDAEKEGVIRGFCGLYSIPLDETLIQEKVQQYEYLSEKIRAADKSVDKTKK